MNDGAFYTEKGFIAAAVFLVVLVFVGIAVAVIGDDSESAPTRAQTRPVETGGSVCGLPQGSQDPVVGPPEARWELVGHIAAPSIADVGPGVVENNDRRCFAHSPMGALVAAANLLALASLPEGTLELEDELRHFVPGRVRDVYARQPDEPVDPAARFQLAGFRMKVMGRDRVDVTLAVRTNINGAIVEWTMPMHWMAPGDWRLRLASLQEPFIGRAVSALTGFVLWSGA